MPPWQVLEVAGNIALPNGEVLSGSVELFKLIYACTSGAVVASMFAYITAQFVDVQLFHFFKRLTKGKHLWIRNNFSTMTSQMVDSVMVVSVTFGAAFFAGSITVKQILILIGSSYLFKFIAAASDTLPFYLLTAYLRRYLQIDNELLLPEGKNF